MDWTPFLILGGFFAFMYMFIVRPQRQRQKKMQELLESLSVGDDVVTIGGLHGRVVSVEDATVTIKVAEGTTVVFDRDTIGRRLQDDEG